MPTKIRYARVTIQRSELHTCETAVPLWEVPILEAIHGSREAGNTAITVHGETLVEREPPDPADEFTRLSNRYRKAKGEDGSFSMPFVAAVYGQFGVGTAALGRAIQEATVQTDDDDLLGAPVSAGG